MPLVGDEEISQLLPRVCCCVGCGKPAANPSDQNNFSKCCIPNDKIQQNMIGTVIRADAERWYEGQYVTCNNKKHRMGKGNG